VTRIQVDEDGVCTFRAPLRVVATCTVADVSDIRMPVNGRTLRLRASGRKVTVLLPMDGLATFLSRVKAAHGPDDPPAEESTEPLVLRTEARALRFQAIVWAVFPVAASYVVWSWSHDAHSAFFKVLVLAWIGFVAWIALRYMRRATTIEVDPSGRCTFRTWAGIVATWPLEEVSEIRLLRDGRTMSLHASGRTVLVTLPMDGISAFVARVRAANPDVAVAGL
jgi:phage terminase large subunit-like protein